MIKPDEREARLMLTLPRNEAGFHALVSAITKHRDQCVQDFNLAAQKNVFDESVRTSALALSGQVKAMNDVLDLLKNLTIGGDDGSRS
ncbi:TPA: hypothetical protein MC918_004509 [Klebsiella pneumoniae]|jgi:hypothetical protein|nr:hypothetical protein [Salmonella enterica subsp. enterica serovar Agona]UVN10733.1 MAG: hypothetical protein [Bacteriophage sp.]DAT55489.1 MAG TPA: hypothetical protein [Caudoviricetes sp.]HBU3785798.1 hypothetical protein [Klebsiella pneumoniae]UVX63156.1 MAG: hypothetical protein [Bacteriophage sp.]